jgi:cyclic pyranopterin phosphate synthase
MPENGVKWLEHQEILSYEEIIRLCKILYKLGIRRVKITGGEPLVRKDVAKLIFMLKQECHMENVTLTTNGTLLKEQLKDLVSAGLDAVNISLDTLEPQKFIDITRRDELEQVMEGMKAALEYPKLTVKVNCVPTESNFSEIVKIAGLAKKQRVNVRFIEMMPIGLGKETKGFLEDDIIQMLSKEYGPLIPCQEIMGNGPSHYFSIDGFSGKIGFISALSHKFCNQCNRIRFTADGQLKLCLQYGKSTDLKTMLRDGTTDLKIWKAMQQAILEKPGEHHFLETINENEVEQHNMSQIGG